MFRKVTLSAAMIVGLFGCGGNPISVQSQKPATQTEDKTLATLPAPTLPTVTVAPITEAPPEPAPTTPAPTSPPTVAPTTVPESPPPAAPGNLEVLTATGVGTALTQPDVIRAIDEIGLTADSAGTYSYYAGQPAYPFVSIDGARLISVDYQNGSIESSEYAYAFDLPDGQTAEATANAAAAPLVARFPEYSTATQTAEEDGRKTYVIELKNPEPGGANWTIAASTDAEYPTLGLVSYKRDDYSVDTPATGTALIPAQFLPTIEATLGQASLPSANLSSFKISSGIRSFGFTGVSMSVEVAMPDQDYATVVQTLTALAGNGWTLQTYIDANEAVYYSKDKDEISVSNRDEYENLPTTVRVRLSLDDNPVGRPGGA